MEECGNAIKLDYTLESPEERNELVKKIISTTPEEKLTPRYIEILTDYIIFAMDKQERKNKKILTDNHMITVNKREISYQKLVGQLEKGEDGIYNMIANDKNIIFTPKVSITEEDIKTIPGLKELKAAISAVEKQFNAETNKKKRYLLKKQLISMYQDQYVIKNSYKPPMYCANLIKSFPKIEFADDVFVDENNEIRDRSFLSFFNPQHISILLCNYSKLKEDSWGHFTSDSYYMMEDLDNLIELTLKDDYPLLYSLLIYKIDGRQNAEIQEKLINEFGTKYSIEYISSLWRNKIPKLLADRAEKEYLNWYFTTQKKGKWKKCTKCGQIKLAHKKFFSMNKTSKDGWYSICKTCRNKHN